MTLYEQMDVVEKTRVESDALMLMLLGEDKEISKCLAELMKDVLKSFPNASGRMRETLQFTIEGDDRASKHAMLFFAMHTRPEWCRKFLKSHNVPAVKFKRFYENGLKANTEKLLKGNLACIQEYVELSRIEYVIT